MNKLQSIIGRRKLNHLLIYVALIVWTIIIFYPVGWAISSSLKYQSEIFSAQGNWIPETPTLSHYINALRHPRNQTYLINTAYVSIAATIGVIILSTTSGYAFSRYNLIGKRGGIMVFIACQMFPPIMFTVPYFILLRNLGLYNTYFALIITRVAFFLPFSTLMVKSFCDSIPKELEEAATVDGCSQLGIFLRIVLPLVGTAIAAVFIFTFLNSWNEFLFSLTVVSRDSLRTITAGLSSARGEYGVDWSNLMALSVISLMAPLIIFMVLQKYFVKGMTAGAVKG